MKKLIFITLVMIAIFTSACKGDDITDDSLAGTTWRYDYEGGYAKLDFKPTSNINLSVIEDGEVEGIFSGKYSVSDNVMGANLYYYADGDEELICDAQVEFGTVIGNVYENKELLEEE